MRRSLVAAPILFALLVVTFALGKANISRIAIRSKTLNSPIEITDSRVLAQYRVWAGPKTSSNEQQSLIVDWARGPVSEPPSTLERYDVSFYAGEGSTSRVVYSVTYVYDMASRNGYVYIPGRNDPRFEQNVRTIFHGTEGKWFHSWSSWDGTVVPLLEAAAAK